MLTDQGLKGLRAISGARALVTGGSGFIGAALCKRLAELDCRVLALSRTIEADGSGVEVRRCDLTDERSVLEAFDSFGPGFVFHLAGEVTGERDPAAVMPTLRGNLLSTINVLESARRRGCKRVVLAGSQEEPDPSLGWPVPSSPYSAAKLAGSNYGRMYAALYSLPVVILRLFMVYGPGQRDTRKLVPHVISTLLRGEITRHTSGNRLVDWVYIDDVVDAFIKAACKPDLAGVTVDVGTGVMTSVRSVVESLYGLIAPEWAPQFGAIPDRQCEPEVQADVSSGIVSLDWRARVELSDGLRRTVDWYRENPRAPEG